MKQTVINRSDRLKQREWINKINETVYNLYFYKISVKTLCFLKTMKLINFCK